LLIDLAPSHDPVDHLDIIQDPDEMTKSSISGVQHSCYNHIRATHTTHIKALLHMERQKPYLMAVCTSDFKLDARRKKKTDLCSYAGQAQIIPFSLSFDIYLLDFETPFLNVNPAKRTSYLSL
jgi:hypothetical protein